MKEEMRKKERVEYYNVYIANDGTEFSNREECEKYDNSARCVLNERYSKLVVGNSSEEDIIGFGCSDDDVELVRIESDDDLNLVLQMLFLINSWAKEESSKDWRERMTALAHRALKEKDTLIVGRGYDGNDFFFYGTTNSMKEKIDRFVSSHTKKDEE